MTRKTLKDALPPAKPRTASTALTPHLRRLRLLPHKEQTQRWVSSDALRSERDRPEKYLRKAKTPLIRQMSTWTVDDILTAQEAHERGEFETSGLLWLWMQRTTRLKAVLRKRVSALSGLTFRLDPASGAAASDPAEVSHAAWLEKIWFEIMPESLLQGLLRCVIGMGAALARVSWIDRDEKWFPCLTLWPADAFYYRDSEQCWYARTREGGDIKVHPGRGWFLWLPDGPLSFQSGSVLSLSIPCYLSSLADSDWANYNAANAAIVRKAIVPRGATRASKDLFLDQLEDLGRDNSSILCERNLDGSGFDFTYEGADGALTKTFLESKEDANKAITIEILGQDKTTDLGANGARSAVEALQGVEDAIVTQDAARFATAFRAQVLKPFFALNFGNDNLAPSPAWEVEGASPADLAVGDKATAEAATALDAALQGTGKVLDKLAYFERAGIPMRDAPV